MLSLERQRLVWVKRYILHSLSVRGVLKKRSFYGQADHKGGQPLHGQLDRTKIVFWTPLMAKKPVCDTFIIGSKYKLYFIS